MSKPRGDHNLFTHFRKDPNCEVGRMTKALSRQMQTQTSETPEGISRPRSLGELIKADHNVVNLENESRDDHHRNALIVQDGFLYRIQS